MDILLERFVSAKPASSMNKADAAKRTIANDPYPWRRGCAASVTSSPLWLPVLPLVDVYLQ